MRGLIVGGAKLQEARARFSPTLGIDSKTLTVFPLSEVRRGGVFCCENISLSAKIKSL